MAESCAIFGPSPRRNTARRRVGTSQAIAFNSPVVLTGSETVSSGGANIGFASTVNGTAGTETLGLTAGTTGNVTFSAAVGGSQAPGTVTINSADNVDITSAFHAAGLVQTAGAGTTTLGAPVTTGSGGVNITANAIAPGFTSTEMVDAIPEEVAAQIKSKIPLQRFAAPEEIAKAAAFLAAEGDYITGQELNVNGGYHM